MKLKTILFCLLCMCGVAMAQVPTMQWVSPLYGGGTSGLASDVLIDGLGNVFSLGDFDAGLDIDPGPGTNYVFPLGQEDGLVTRMDANGNLVWLRQFGGSGGDVFPKRMEFDGGGNLVITGSFYGTVDFDPGSGVVTKTSLGWHDLFVLKLTPSGGLVWVQTIGGSNSNVLVGDLGVYPNGDLLLVGSFDGVVDADPGTGTYTLTNNSGSGDAFFIWLSGTGVFGSASVLSGTTTIERGDAVEMDAAGNAYIQGKFGGTKDFDLGAGVFTMTSTGSSDLFVLKLNPTHGFVWAKRLGGSGEEVVMEMCLSSNDNLFLHGWFDLTVDFDPGPGVVNLTATGPLNGYDDGYVLKLDANGSFVWVKRFDAGYPNSTAGGSSEPISMVVDAQDRVLLADHATNNVDLDPSPTVVYDLFDLYLPGSQYRYLLQLDASGNLEWARLLGGIGPNYGGTWLGRIARGAGGTIYLVGNFNQTVDFDIGPGVDSLNGANSSFFVEKFWECPSTNTVTTATACSSYTWRGNTYTASGTYYDVLSSITGCDSILTLDLTIAQSTSQTVSATACDSYTLNGQTYSSSGSYTQQLTNVLGCDSLVTLNLTVNNSTDTTLVVSRCNAYLLNGVQYTTTGNYTQVRPNAQGCDSLIHLNLTINGTTYGSVYDSSCTAVTVNGQTYTASGLYLQVRTNAAGCDSMLSVFVQIYQAVATISPSGNGLTCNQAGATAYQWLDCNNGYAPVPGATSQAFAPSSTGSYAVELTQWQCKDTSSCLNAVGVGMGGAAVGSNWTVSPNPSRGLVRLDLGGEVDGIEVRLTDGTGRRIYQQSAVVASEMLLSLEGLPAGVYCLQVVAGEANRTFIVVKQ